MNLVQLAGQALGRHKADQGHLPGKCALGGIDQHLCVIPGIDGELTQLAYEEGDGWYGEVASEPRYQGPQFCPVGFCTLSFAVAFSLMPENSPQSSVLLGAPGALQRVIVGVALRLVVVSPGSQDAMGEPPQAAGIKPIVTSLSRSARATAKDLPNPSPATFLS